MVVRSHRSKNRQYNGHKRLDKVVIRSHKSKNRQYNGQKKKNRQHNGQKKIKGSALTVFTVDLV